MGQAQINVRTRACSRTSIARTRQAALTHNVRGKELINCNIKIFIHKKPGINSRASLNIYGWYRTHHVANFCTGFLNQQIICISILKPSRIMGPKRWTLFRRHTTDGLCMSPHRIIDEPCLDIIPHVPYSHTSTFFSSPHWDVVYVSTFENIFISYLNLLFPVYFKNVPHAPS